MYFTSRFMKIGPVEGEFEYCDWAEDCKQRSTGSIPSKGKRFFSSPNHAIWSLQNLLFNGCRG
jgi:hypothetical protein